MASAQHQRPHSRASSLNQPQTGVTHRETACTFSQDGKRGCRSTALPQQPVLRHMLDTNGLFSFHWHVSAIPTPAPVGAKCWNHPAPDYWEYIFRYCIPACGHQAQNLSCSQESHPEPQTVLLLFSGHGPKRASWDAQLEGACQDSVTEQGPLSTLHLLQSAVVESTTSYRDAQPQGWTHLMRSQMQLLTAVFSGGEWRPGKQKQPSPPPSTHQTLFVVTTMTSKPQQ